MSERTKCNYCTLEAIKRANPGKEVTVVRVNFSLVGLEVFVDGKPTGIWFQDVSDHCVCYN